MVSQVTRENIQVLKYQAGRLFHILEPFVLASAELLFSTSEASDQMGGNSSLASASGPQEPVNLVTLV